MNSALNPEGLTFRQDYENPRIALLEQSRYPEYLAGEWSRTRDAPAALPERWRFWVDNQNIYDAAYFGAELRFDDHQAPDTICPWTENADFLISPENELALF